MAEFQDELNQATTTARKSPTIAALNTEFLNFKAFICSGLSVLRTEIDTLRNNVDRLEMRFRNKMLLVHGVPEQSGENTRAKIVSSLALRCSVPSPTMNSIVASFRMDKAMNNSSKPRHIVVKFAETSVRAALWKSKTMLKGTKITLSEFLTKTRHDVFTATRQRFGVSNCWTLDGTIHIKTPNGKRRKLESMTELTALASEH
ncbi:unnamed protein product [Diatraea saccharalis]|uniref:Zinc finger DNA binding protein n=1 Tax=Diatraea saccharalis TaxID=40085 RepID=A0A9N9WF34_9NEOP|nr:unnamed protein product [Diatraea saccharalis]